MSTSKQESPVVLKVSVSRAGEEIKRHKVRHSIRARGLALPNPVGNKDGFSVRKHRYYFLSHKSILYLRYIWKKKRPLRYFKCALDNPMPSVFSSHEEFIVSQAIGVAVWEGSSSSMFSNLARQFAACRHSLTRLIIALPIR